MDRGAARRAAAGAVIVAVVLAAGLSRRMGRNKLLARNKRGESLIGCTVAGVQASGVDQILVVVGHGAREVRAVMRGMGVACVFCPDYASGMAASLRAGVAALPAGTVAALVCLGDMPLIGRAVIAPVLAARAGGDIVVPVCGGVRGHPVLWDRRFFTPLMALEGDRGGKALLATYAECVREVDVDDPALVRDVDCAADFIGLPGGPWALD